MERQRLKIVVAFDFTERGRRTLMEAIKAGRRDAQLHVMHVATASEVTEQKGETEIERQNAALEKLRRKVWAEVYWLLGEEVRTTPVSVEICLGHIDEEILRVASAMHADWIVIGAGDRVLPQAPCPVLRVRKNELSRIEGADRILPAREVDQRNRRRNTPMPHYEPRERGLGVSESITPASSGGLL